MYIVTIETLSFDLIKSLDGWDTEKNHSDLAMT